MGVRDCPAAVSGNDRRHHALGSSRPGKRRPVGDRVSRACPRVRRPASAPHASCAAVGGRAGGPTPSAVRCDRSAGRRLWRPPCVRRPRRQAEEGEMTVTRERATNGPAGAEQRRQVMGVRKRNGDTEPVDVNKIVRAVERWVADLDEVDPLRVATKTISGLYDGATTAELDRLSIQTAAELIGEEPQYSKLAARLLAAYVDKEVRGQQVASFSQSIRYAHGLGLISDETAAFVSRNARKLDDAVDPAGDLRFEYFGLRTVADRYLLRHPQSRLVVETPQYWLLRVACGLSGTPAEAIGFYRLMSSLAYLPSSPTLFNSGTRHTQMSSCFLVDSPRDELDSIYQRYHQVAKLSKFSGGIGIAWSRVRGRGALIRGTNGRSNGIVPFLKTLDAGVAAVNQGGRRKGAACVYLEPWHPDIEEFLELRDNTGEDARRTHNLNLANWLPDEFMRRVEADGDWSLIDPSEAPELPDLYGEEFDAAYRVAEKKAVRTVKARDLYGRMMRTLAQTGNGWMTFKDRSNTLSNQTGEPGNTIHLSNLCTEILEVNNDAETAVCNLGSVNLGAHVTADGVDWEKLRDTVRTAVVFLDRVIDINYYPAEQAAASNPRWRPVGLGLMGLQDAFFTLRLPFDSAEASELSTRVQEEIFLTALETSAGLAERFGPHPAYAQTRAARGDLHPELWGAVPSQPQRWAGLKARVGEHGLRNSLLVAIAPTATIASIAGCYECIEPQVSNLFKRETMSGEFLQVNTYLVGELKARGLWTASIRDQIKRAEGSVQGLAELPAEVRELFRTAWELPQRALIDLAAARAPYIDQSQSLNLFLAAPTIGKLSSMYLYAWKSGLKTTYYLRSRPATRIQQATVAVTSTAQPGVAVASSAQPGGAASSISGFAGTDAEALACSLENPESCEACQ
ncbi:ribonucleoside-diphosphate reductase, alpha subunit [Salinispora tropica CNB-440]|uniref:Ribonucleoside-diphosphate reductase n=2 Tax=Salinispora tropica TaxID=168695 RepID=A4XD09_SALTO|nr:ribonucleoside-diphosphate reductase, alpha subunit [Salinispora tropica CNB-440]